MMEREITICLRNNGQLIRILKHEYMPPSFFKSVHYGILRKYYYV